MQPIKAPKYIILLAMLYLTAFIFPLMLAYRMVHLGPFLLPGGTLFFPLSYFLGDVIAEVYGYSFSRQLVWSAILCQLIAGAFITLVLHLPTPTYWHAEADFVLVLGNSLRYAFASTIGNFFGEFINVYLISKSKILLKGKHFWLRSLAATCIGEGTLTIVVFFITFVGITNTHHVIDLMLSAYTFKMLFSIIGVLPATFLVFFLKQAEGIDAYDHAINYNPFKLSSSNPITSD
jgi:queuosine precursor transporter